MCGVCVSVWSVCGVCESSVDQTFDFEDKSLKSTRGSATLEDLLRRRIAYAGGSPMLEDRQHWWIA